MTELLLHLAAKGLVVVALGGLVASLFRRRSASTQHLIWTAVLAGLFALPLLSLASPRWNLPLLPAEPLMAVPENGNAPADLPPGPGETPAAGAGHPVATTSLASETTGLTLDTALLWLWLMGAVLSFGPTLVAAGLAGSIQRRCTPLPPALEGVVDTVRDRLGLKQRLDVVMAAEEVIPMTWGLWRARVVLPASARDWSLDRLEMVLVHELAHVRRRDWLTQTLGQLAAAIHWFNPLAWIARRRQRIAAEHACDDAVVTAGADATSYADSLLGLARTLRRAPLVSDWAVPMAHPSLLERRLLMILDSNADRRPPRQLAVLVLVAGAIALVLPLAGMSVVAAPDDVSPTMGSNEGNAIDAGNSGDGGDGGDDGDDRTPETLPAFLRARATVDFEDQPLEEIFEFLHQILDKNFIVYWNRLEKVGIRPNTEVEMKLSDSTVAQILTGLMAATGDKMGYTVQEGCVVIDRRSKDTRVLRKPWHPSADESPESQELLKRLERPMDLEFDNQQLSQSIEFLTMISGQNIVVPWDELKKAKITRDSTVTIRLKGVSLRAGLRFIAQSMSPRLTYEVRKGIIVLQMMPTPGKVDRR